MFITSMIDYLALTMNVQKQILSSQLSGFHRVEITVGQGAGFDFLDLLVFSHFHAYTAYSLR